MLGAEAALRRSARRRAGPSATSPPAPPRRSKSSSTVASYRSLSTCCRYCTVLLVLYCARLETQPSGERSHQVRPRSAYCLASVGCQTDSPDVRKQAVRTISNMTKGGSPDQIQHVVSQGAIPALVGAVSSDDEHTATAALEGLECILNAERARTPGSDTWPWCDVVRECEGVDRLEALWSHAAHGVCAHAVSRSAPLRRGTCTATQPWLRHSFRWLRGYVRACAAGV